MRIRKGTGNRDRDRKGKGQHCEWPIALCGSPFMNSFSGVTSWHDFSSKPSMHPLYTQQQQGPNTLPAKSKNGLV